MKGYNICTVVLLLACCTSILAVETPTWSDVQNGFKHGRPAPPTNISDYNSQFFIDYSYGMLPLITPAIVIAVLTPIVAAVYIIIRCCCSCCSCCSNRKKKNDYDVLGGQSIPDLYPSLAVLSLKGDEREEKEQKLYSKKMRVIPSVFYCIFMCGILAACVLGYLGSIDLSHGLDDIKSTVDGVSDDTLHLADNLTVSLAGVANQTTYNLNDLVSQLSGLPTLATRVEQLQGDINSTQLQVNNISVQVTNISNSVNLTVLQNLISNMDQITEESSTILGNITSLIGQLNVVSNCSFNDMTAHINEAIADVNSAVNQSNSYINSTKELMNTVDDYNSKVADYNHNREIGYDIMFAVVFAACAFAAMGFLIKKSFSFHITAACGFLFCFVLWICAAFHIVLWVLISDACPVIDPVIHSIPADDDVTKAMHGCLSGNQTLFESLDLQNSLNFSLMHEYQADFINFTDFVNTYNFTEIDDYLDEVNSLYVYNLTAVAANITVETFGWNSSKVYDGLDRLNQLTEPYGHAYSLQNYTSLNLNDFPPGEDQKNINDSKNALDELVATNATVYNELEQTQFKLNGAQDSIDTLVANMADYTKQYNALRTDVQSFSSQNASRAINITEDIETMIDGLVTLGNCSFVGMYYEALLDTMCSSIKPTLLWLIVSLLLLGFSIIAIIVLVEVLAVRIPNPLEVDGYFSIRDDRDFLRTTPTYGTTGMSSSRRDSSQPYQRPKDNPWD